MRTSHEQQRRGDGDAGPFRPCALTDTLKRLILNVPFILNVNVIIASSRGFIKTTFRGVFQGGLFVAAASHVVVGKQRRHYGRRRVVFSRR